MCNISQALVNTYESIPTEQFDIAFIDPSLGFDPTGRLRADIKIFYDCEDSPRDFYPGVAYETLKDTIQYYAKMNWVDDDRGDGIKNIGYPLSVYMSLAQVASIETSDFTHQNAFPFLVAAGTFIGNYKPTKPLENFKSRSDIHSLGKYDDGTYLYNQRIDWLLSLQDNNIPYAGGMVFKGDNLSKEWQSKYFGEGVVNLEHPPVSQSDYYSMLMRGRVGLCPTGHDRMSWRLFDIMATGAILIWTDNKDQQSMYMPKSFIQVEDGEDLGSLLLEIQPHYKEIWRDCQRNREVFLGLSPESIWKDFLKQMEIT